MFLLINMCLNFISKNNLQYADTYPHIVYNKIILLFL